MGPVFAFLFFFFYLAVCASAVVHRLSWNMRVDFGADYLQNANEKVSEKIRRAEVPLCNLKKYRSCD